MNILNKKFKKLIIVMSALIVSALLTACGNAMFFDGKGSAEIYIDFDKTYEGLTLSCPEGIVEKTEDAYKITLSTRNMVDVIVFCAGYETETINFTTSQLASGYVSKTVSLKQKRNFIYANIVGIKNLADISVESQNQGQILSTEIVNKNIVIEIKELRDEVISFSCKGYYTNSIEIKKQDYKNHKYNLKVPLISEESENMAVVVTNENKSYISFEIRTYDYQEYVQSVFGSDDIVIYLDKGNDYVFDYHYLLSKRKIQQAFEDENPYIYIDSKEIYKYQNEQEDILQIKYDDALPALNDNDCTIEILDSKGNNRFIRDYYDGFKYSSGVDSAKAGEEYIVKIFIFDWNKYCNELVSHYKHTVTEEELASNRIVLRKHIENILELKLPEEIERDTDSNSLLINVFNIGELVNQKFLLNGSFANIVLDTEQGDELLILIKDGNQLLSLYRHKVTSSELDAKVLQVEIKTEDITSKIKLVDEYGALFTQAQALLHDLNLDTINDYVRDEFSSEHGEIVTFGSVCEGMVEISITNLFKYGFYALKLTSEEYYFNDNFINFDEALKEEYIITAYKNKKLKFNFYDNGVLVSPEQVVLNTDGKVESGSLIFDDFRNFHFFMKSNFKQLSHEFKFNEEVFYIDDEGFYCYDVNLIEVITISIYVNLNETNNLPNLGFNSKTGLTVSYDNEKNCFNLTFSSKNILNIFVEIYGSALDNNNRQVEIRPYRFEITKEILDSRQVTCNLEFMYNDYY